MKKIFIVVLLVLIPNLIAYSQDSDSLKAQLETFKDSNSRLIHSSGAFLGNPSLKVQETIVNDVFKDEEEQYYKQMDSLQITNNKKENYTELPTPDSANKVGVNSEKFQFIIIPFIDENGLPIELVWGKTADGVISNQKVDAILEKGIKRVISNANTSLINRGIPPIVSIYVSATTNGKHHKDSNHYRGTAIDISRINGERLINTGRSQVLSGLFSEFLGNPEILQQENLKFESFEYDTDLLLLFERVNALQLSFQKLPNRRENFGPIYNTKYFSDTNKNIYEYNPNVALKHKDHIHFSVK